MDISSLRERKNNNPLTVSELNGYIKSMFENDRFLSAVTVKGEISNFVSHRSGHLYFTLKDGEGQIKAVMFRSYAARVKFSLQNGMKVIVHGSVKVYTKDGSFQFYANQIQPDGVGALYLAYEQLKEKLYAEGLFDTSNKLPIPKYPSKIGVITSPTGAAIRDILNILARRFPCASVYVYPALVQGEGAEDDLTSGVDYFDKSSLVDLVIIGRGGGSIEDLWAFNSEKLARRIYDARVPIISAVGHEIDFTICDFVSDFRAPTPSAAAELAVPDIKELYLRLDSCLDSALRMIKAKAERNRIRLDNLESKAVFKEPEAIFENAKERVEGIDVSLYKSFKNTIDSKKNALALIAEKAQAISPLATLGRGYSVVLKENTVVKSIGEIVKGDCVSLRLSDGVACAEIKNTKEGQLKL